MRRANRGICRSGSIHTVFNPGVWIVLGTIFYGVRLASLCVLTSPSMSTTSGMLGESPRRLHTVADRWSVFPHHIWRPPQRVCVLFSLSAARYVSAYVNTPKWPQPARQCPHFPLHFTLFLIKITPLLSAVLMTKRQKERRIKSTKALNGQQQSTN